MSSCYIIYTSLNEVDCICDVIIGIAKNISEVTELIWNYSSMQKELYNNSFKDCINEPIIIAKISLTNYATLMRIYKNNIVKLEQRFNELTFGKWKYDGYSALFWYGVFNYEINDEIIFTSKEQETINNIISESNILC